ncbi:ribonuclease T2 family protein [Antarcticirhabdus aurantiaca]|uniref:Ribonuclease n=2 Tax=Antarcticirhabdus aurantiaca TaxID=2606717 RepID=A0ACD4NT99_9HYPH|nr:ribonuclease [Jeongeuplla avenae]
MILAVLTLLLAAPAAAQVPMTGDFVASARCPALQSIREESNPGGVAVEPGRRYDLLGRNADRGTHYLLRIPGARPERRWVAFGCGEVVESNQSARGEPPPSPPGTPAREGLSGEVVLAASWQLAFCETKPRAAECRTGSGPVRFSLHGLWPRGEYCGVEELAGLPWAELPEPDLTLAERAALEAVMPGVASGLHRHEWAKHGTCSGLDADTYYAEAIRLVEVLNASPVAALFAENLGDRLDAGAVRQAFDAAFGRGAGRRVMLDCARDGRRTLVGELRINLRYGATSDTSLPALLAAAAPAPDGCPGGIVDPPGFQ